MPSSIYKTINILISQFEYIEATFKNESNEVIEFTDFFSISLYNHVIIYKKLSEIEEKLNKDYLNIKNRYIRLKRCKYILLILKTVLISLSIGLSFINPLIVIVSSTIPMIDSIMLITEKDKKVCDLKLQKAIINQIIKEIEIKRYTFNNDEEVEKYIIELYGKIQTFLDI